VSRVRALVLGLCMLAACGDDGGHAIADAPMHDTALQDATDGGVDSAPDTALPDATLPDAAPPDATAPDAAAPDALPDAALPDATLPDAPPIDAAAPDAPALDAAIDAAPDSAPPPDAPALDAPAIDAPAIDAPPGASWTFSRATYDFGAIPTGTGYTQVVNIGVINTGAVPLTTSVDVTSGLVLSGSPGTVPVGAERYAHIRPLAATTPTDPGALAETLTITVDGIPTSIPITGSIDGVFTNGGVAGDGGSLSITGLTQVGAYQVAPAGTDVVATVTSLPTDGAITGWSNPACGTAMSCTYEPAAAAQTIQATSQVTTTGDTIELDLDGAGSLDDVQVSIDGAYPTQVCGASCTIAVDSTLQVGLYGESPDASAIAFSAPCSANPCELLGYSGTITATFTHVTGERVTRLPDQVYSVDFDASGNLLVGTAGGVYAMANDFTPLWNAPVAGFARWDGFGNAYVVSATTITKLAPTGATIWTASGGEPPVQQGSYSQGPLLAATQDGGIVLVRPDPHAPAVDIYSPTGTLTAHALVAPPTTYPNGGPHAVAVAPDDGTIFVGTDSVDDEGPDKCDIQWLSPAGVLNPGFEPATGIDALSCNLAVGTHRVVVGMGDGGDDRGVQSFDRATWAVLVSIDEDYTVYQPDVMRAVAAGADDTIAFQASPEPTGVLGLIEGSGIDLSRWDASSTQTFQLRSRGTTFEGQAQWSVYSLVNDLALSPSDQIAIGGIYASYSSYGGIVIVYP
jgi:hypothetical protein